MSIVKTLSVGNGDMFYIQHGSDNFTIIDCNISDDKSEDIIKELKEKSKDKGITRFISTHPDEDHIFGLTSLDKKLPIINFYCVKNKATKEDETADFKKYCSLRDSEKSFYIYKDCTRRWMNKDDKDRGSSGIYILWPDRSNEYFKKALQEAENGSSPNNISPIIKYSLESSGVFIWMGDLESEYMSNIENELSLPKTHILFAPHHGRESGKVPSNLLKKMKPDVIIIGEAPSNNLNYYNGYNTITQNSAGDITFECISGFVDIYVSNENYQVEFLKNRKKPNNHDGYYIGSIEI